MTANIMVRQVDGLTFVGKGGSGHWTAMDGLKEFGGSEGASSPKELLLVALAGCTGSDVASILTKKRTPYTGLEIYVSAEVAEDHPKVYNSIHVEYVVRGDSVKASDIERAIELSETKYCSVSAMLRKSAPITSSYRIERSPVNGRRKSAEVAS